MALAVFLGIVTVLSVLWGRANRIGYRMVITTPARFIMKFSRVTEEQIRSYLVWLVYMGVGLITAVTLLAMYRVDLLAFLPLSPGYLWAVPVAFVAQNSLTGILMQLWLVARPNRDVFTDLVGILWVRYTLAMPRALRMVAPLCAALTEEVFFRGAVFLILIIRFPWLGPSWAIAVCTVLFVVQQVLQTDTVGQAVIFLVGSTSLSVVGCLVTLYTGSFLPTLVCHAAYAVVYLQLGTALPKWSSRAPQSRPGPAYSSF